MKESSECEVSATEAASTLYKLEERWQVGRGRESWSGRGEDVERKQAETFLLRGSHLGGTAALWVRQRGDGEPGGLQ